MKKILIIAFLALGMTASAQDNKQTSNEKSKIVYVTANGKKYHTHKDCQYCKNSETKQASEEQAKKHGLTICARCSAKDNKQSENKTKSSNFDWAK